jgi:hypothetical protein
VDQRLVGLGLLAGEAAKLGEQLGSNANGDQLLGIPGRRPADAAGAAEFFTGRLPDIGEIDSAIRRRLCVPCGSLGTHR